MSKRNQITYRKSDPPFLRRIREKIGYQEPSNIDTKRESLGQSDDLDSKDLSDEAPTVVITENSNVSKEEQEDYAEKLSEVKPMKILFKKPIKKGDKEETSDKWIDKQSENAKVSSGASKQVILKRHLDDSNEKEDKSKKAKQNEKKINFYPLIMRMMSFDQYNHQIASLLQNV